MSSKEWEKYKLSQLSERITKGTTPTTLGYSFVNSGINFIKAESILVNGYIDSSKFVYIDEFTHGRLKRSQLAEGDILFSMAGMVLGKSAVVRKEHLPANTNQALAVIRLKTDRVNPFFVNYFMRQREFFNYVNTSTGQSAQPNINLEEIGNLEIDVPNMQTQNRIVSILSTLDNKIELNRQTNQTLQAIAQAIYKEWFVNFNFPTSEGKPYRASGGKMQDNELGPIPKGWRVVAFEDELEAERGLSYKGKGLATSDAMPMHNLNSVYEGGGYKSEGIKFYSGEYKEKHIVQPGDLIIANTEQGHKYLLIGYPAIVPHVFGDVGIYSHHIYRLRPKPSSYLTSDFLYQLLLQPEIREQVVGFANGTTVNMLKIEGLQKPKFILPPKDMISKFSRLAINFRLRQEENIEQSTTLSTIRDALLPKLMNGEIEVGADL